MTARPIAYCIAELWPCDALNDSQRAKGATCARYANGGECMGRYGGECSEAEGGVWRISDIRIERCVDEPFASDGYWWEAER